MPVSAGTIDAIDIHVAQNMMLMIIEHCFACRSLLRHCNFSINGCINHHVRCSCLSRILLALLRRESNLQHFVEEGRIERCEQKYGIVFKSVIYIYIYIYFFF